MMDGGWISLLSNGFTQSSLRLPCHPSHQFVTSLSKSLLLAHRAIRWSLLVLGQQPQPVLPLPPAIQQPAESGIDTSKLGVNGSRQLIICHYLLLSECIPAASPSLGLSSLLPASWEPAPAQAGRLLRGWPRGPARGGGPGGRAPQPGSPCPARAAQGSPMRPPPRGTRQPCGLALGLLALCLAAARALQGRGVSLYIPQAAINATVEEDILLSVDYSCHGVPTIEWRYTSSWGAQKLVEWRPGTQANISRSHRDRLCTFDNGSIQLFSVGVRDSGYYVIRVTERLGGSQLGTIVLHVSEILYEDLHFVAVFLALLAAAAALLVSLLWLCNQCACKFQRKRRHKLQGKAAPRGEPASRSRPDGCGHPGPGNRVRPVAAEPLAFALQRAPRRRSSCRTSSVSRGCARLRSHLPGRTASSSRRSQAPRAPPSLPPPRGGPGAGPAAAGHPPARVAQAARPRRGRSQPGPAARARVLPRELPRGAGGCACRAGDTRSRQALVRWPEHARALGSRFREKELHPSPSPRSRP
uniref:Immunoglobulin domain-containing protein n=1 Tax=Canis lupus familiaris TaxID=9615 RepID=A0A8C0SY96_CANLF